jgi:glutathione S-transferase
MIELHQFAPKFGLLNASPFCMKVEVFLRLAGLPYETVDASPIRAPKGKLPVLCDGATRVPDSEAIVAWLQATYGTRMPTAMAEPETPRQHLLRRTFEEHLYFIAVHFRWVEDAGWAQTRAFFDEAPAPLRGLLGAIVRRKMRRDLAGQGIGRHDRATIAAKGIADLDAIAAELGPDPWFGGDQPAAIDAVAYAFLANLLRVPIETPVKAHAATLQGLVAYVERMRARIGG